MTDNIIGRFAVSKAGHDAEVLYVVTAADEKYVYLSDGRFHTLDKPKRKNRRHIQLLEERIPEDLLNRFYNKEKVFDHEIKYVIKKLGKEEGHVQE